MEKFLFADTVVIDKDQIGVVVKSWVNQYDEYSYEVYVRSYNEIKRYVESEIQRYRVRHKYLDEQGLEWQESD